MADDLGHGEEHDIVGGSAGDGRVLRSVVHKVGDRLAGLGAQEGLADGIVGLLGEQTSSMWPSPSKALEPEEQQVRLRRHQERQHKLSYS